MAVDVFLDEIPEYAIEDRIMYVSVNGWRMAMPLRAFRLGMARAAKVIAEYEAKRAEVVPLRRGKRGGH